MEFLLRCLMLLSTLVVLGALSWATYIHIPRGEYASKMCIFSWHYTDPLRVYHDSGKFKRSWGRWVYWGIPVSVLLFSNLLAGLVLLAAGYIGVQFSKRAIAHSLRY